MRDVQHVASFDGTPIAWRVDAPADALTKAGKVRKTRTAIVLCNGISCDDVYWTHVWGPLAEHTAVVRWHYRGHGDSGRPVDAEAVKVADVVRDLGAVLDVAGIQRAILVGHSFGVQVVSEAVRTLGDRLAGLVCVAGTYGHPIMRVGPWNPGVAVFDVAALTTRLPGSAAIVSALVRTPLAYAVARAVRMVGPAAPREDMDRWFAHLATLDMTVITRMMRAMQQHTAEDLLPDLPVPLVAIPGGRDWATPTRILRRMVERVPDGRLIEVPAASHVLPIEYPEPVIEQTLALLAEVG